MRCAPIWTLVLVLGLAPSAWAQFGGGGFGNGGVMEGGMGGFEVAPPPAQEGIAAYRPAPGDAGRFQVTWTGTDAQASQKIAARMQDETKVQFVDTPLSEVVAYLKNLHHIPIVIDQTALDDSDIDLDVPINANFESLTLAAALDLLTQQHELGWIIEKGALVITSYDAADERLSTRIYKLHQLEAVGAAKVVEKIVFPESWNALGGHADIAVIRDRNLLVIRQNREGHEAVESLLTQLESMK
ncbi:hypothetical protein Pan97_50290 [Bremerella volcania]|uniref:Bacterial type II/III secretion system short domain protein n=1 Tax=Bremerella volcania TaxID=2527984 RepID=A0A518CFE4_9BACT|nr:hypothetical protein [Bremerella volcania]QDU77950.1 hypothetical protein Pan97_50290 [Bremerella volcania]